jgi:hypothetical protein
VSFDAVLATTVERCDERVSTEQQLCLSACHLPLANPVSRDKMTRSGHFYEATATDPELPTM